MDDKEIEKIWYSLTDVPFDEDENGELVLSMRWQNFSKGTAREELWHWFDEHHSKGIAYLLYKRES